MTFPKNVEFVTQLKWPSNGQMLRAAQYKIDVPGGVPVTAIREPNYVDVPGMSAVSRSGSTLAQGPGGQMGTINGLVTSKVTLRFDDGQRQWASRPLGGPNQGPVEFTFQGGKVFLDLSLGIYVLNTCKPAAGDTVSEKIFSVVYSHELLHVLDNFDMINTWFMPKLKMNRVIDDYLIKGKPYVFGRQTDQAQQLRTEFPNFITDKLETEAHDIWAVEANRRQAIRDARVEYAKIQEKINDLRSSRTRRRP